MKSGAAALPITNFFAVLAHEGRVSNIGRVCSSARLQENLFESTCGRGAGPFVWTLRRLVG